MNKFIFPLFSLFIVFLLTLSSCEDEVFQEPSVITEEVLFVSGENARFLGRVITNQVVDVADHGFYISETENFSNPKIISLGERNRPGRFIGEVTGLSIQKNYFVKAFVKVGDAVYTSDILTLRTLSPKIDAFFPTSGLEGELIAITGSNFTNDTKVFFGTREAQVVKRTFESLIQVRVPAIQNKPLETVRVVTQGKEMVFGLEFEYVIGKYSKLPNFPFPDRIFENIALFENGNLYVGLGNARTNSLISNIWKYDTNSSAWSNTGFAGRSLFMAFSSSTYFGGGTSVISKPPYTFARDFWKIQNGAFVKLPDLPFDNIKALAFETATSLYVMGGELADSKSVWMYEKSSGTWRQLSSAPIPINYDSFHFHYGGNHYFISPEKDLYQFQLSNNSWTVISKFPGIMGNGRGLGLVIGDRVYLGLGGRSNELWELNMTNLNWVRKRDFTGSISSKNVGAYTQGGLLYFLRSAEIELPGAMEFWSLDPKGF
jgi:hypothetical protein